jgi:hypothetical protein
VARFLFVEDEAEAVAQLIEVRWFIEELEDAVSVEELHVETGDRGGINDDRDIPQLFILFDLCNELFAIHQGNVDVKKDQIGILREVDQFRQRFFSVFGNDAGRWMNIRDLMDCFDEQVAIVRIVFHIQDSHEIVVNEIFATGDVTCPAIVRRDENIEQWRL